LEMPKTCLIVCVVRISGDLFVIIMCFLFWWLFKNSFYLVLVQITNLK